MADEKVNPIQVQKYLGGMDYPASREELISHARDQGADQKVLGSLEHLPERSYDGPNAVSKALGEAA